MNQPLHYKIIGEGEVIVLLHGFLASSHYFKDLQKQLATTHKVVAIDLLGFGKSPKPLGYYGYKDHIAAIHDTLTQLGITRFLLVGHSLGALIALRYSITYQKEVSRLVLFNPPMYQNPKEAIETLTSTKYINLMLHSPYKYVGWRLLKTLPRFPSRGRPSVNLTDVLRATANSRQSTYTNIILQAAFFEDIQKLNVPTLLVVGKRDRAQYHTNLKEWRPLPSVRLHIANTGHHTTLKHPALAENLIREHLKR
jgi:pimeloyl-ACP methyl ester carboxylesterase